jgi:hypothetical protein
MSRTRGHQLPPLFELNEARRGQGFHRLNEIGNRRFADYITRDNCSAPVRGADPLRPKRRTHSDQHVAQIAASIREFGFTNPVLIDDEDGIIAGHGRVLAAHLLGLDEVP